MGLGPGKSLDLSKWTEGKGHHPYICPSIHPPGASGVPSPGWALPATASLTLTRPQFGGRDHPHFNHRTTGAWRHEQAAPGQPERQDPANWAGRWVGALGWKGKRPFSFFQLSQRLESQRSASPQITCYRGRRRSSCPTAPLQCGPHLGSRHRAGGAPTPSLCDGARPGPLSGSERRHRLLSRTPDGWMAQEPGEGGPRRAVTCSGSRYWDVQAASRLEMPPRAARMSSGTARPARLSFLLGPHGPDTGGEGVWARQACRAGSPSAFLFAFHPGPAPTHRAEPLDCGIYGFSHLVPMFF